MSTAYNIHLMRMSMDLREILMEQERQERRNAQREIDEIYRLQELIWTYGFDGNEELYDSWMLAGPDGRTAYLNYCRAEWARIAAEIVMAHRLAGLSLVVEYSTTNSVQQ